MSSPLLTCLLLCSLLTFGQNKTVTSNQKSTLPAVIIGDSIIVQTLNSLENNNPEKVLSGFSFKTHSKTILQKEDTLGQAQINEYASYFYEKLSLNLFDGNRKHKEIVLASHMPGFDHPVHSLFEKQFTSHNIYNREYQITGEKFLSPISKKGLKSFVFEFNSTVTETAHPYHIIHFYPKKTIDGELLEGELHINTSSFAVQKAMFRHRAENDFSVTHIFTYHKELSLWLPSETILGIQPINNKAPFSLFSKSLALGTLNLDHRKEFHNKLLYKVRYFDYVFDDIAIEDKNIAVEALETGNNNDPGFWESYRQAPLTAIERDVINYADSLVTKRHTATRLEYLENFNNGYVRVAFWDIDLKYLIKFNNYEGFRLGFGGVTNDKLSSFFKLEGYVARGFKDEKYKYSVGSNFLLNKESQTVLTLNYTDDVNEVGTNKFLTDKRVYSLFEPRLINITKFYTYQEWRSGLQHNISPGFLSEIQISRSKVEQTNDYAFFQDETLFSDYTLSEAKLAVRWSPFSAYIKTPKGTREMEEGFPKFSAQLIQNFKGLLQGDFNFTKIDLKVDQQWFHYNRSHTEVILEGNLGIGAIPITHLYHAYPNSPDKETILNRFSVAGIRSFETMFFNEFFSEKLASIQIKHHLRPFLVSSRFKPEMVLISRHAIGTASNLEKHQNITFNTLENGYSESGFELNKLFLGFGLSFAYRYGAYHLPDFEDNVSFKFTFNLKL